jgi:hypothetical protein
MAGPIAQAGGTVEPSEYAALAMDEQFTGMWTQRNPLRDADVPFLYRKFYSASRIDSIIDGINREISPGLTDKRRCGSSVYNSNTFPAANSMGTFKWTQNGAQQVRVIYDGKDGTIYDATAGQKTALYAKAAGAGKARFLGVGPTLFFGDGVEQKKILRSALTWQANTNFNIGNYIIDSNGNAQSVQSTGTATISEVSVVRSRLGNPLGPFSYFLAIVFTAPTNWAAGVPVYFAGLTTYTALNNRALRVVVNNIYLPPATNTVYFPAIIPTLYGPTVDTGTGTSTGNPTGTGSGLSGATQPAWATGLGALTVDNALIWMCFGPPVYNWQIAAPLQAPTLIPNPLVRFWLANTGLSQWFSLLDSNNNIQVAVNATGGNYITGSVYPTWGAVSPNSVNAGIGVSQTADGSITWLNCGPVLGWVASGKFYSLQCILDSNQNLQICTNGAFPSGGTAGGSAPSWATTIGATTTDGALTWTCVGPGVALLTAPESYGCAYHSIDGSLTSISPLATFSPNGAVLGPANAAICTVTGLNTTDNQCDQIWIYRTPQGTTVPLLLVVLPNPSVGTSAQWNFLDTLPATALSVTQTAMQNGLGTPPPAGLTGPELHVGRIFGFVGSILYYSDGANATVIGGNGNTSFAPLNSYQLPEQITRVKSVTVQGGGLLIICAANTYILLGAGTTTSPFEAPKIYMDRVGVSSYDECAFSGSTMYAFTNSYKAISFDPSNGYAEIGFPIGDQFQQVTTGGITAALYTPGSCFVTWHEKYSGDTGLMVSDGAVGWFRYSPVSPPESGSLWSPRAAIAGGTSAVQSVETATGVFNLLIAPATSGPILMRDTTVFADNGAPYPSWDVKGSIGLCETGEVAEIAHIALKSRAVGARPIVSLLLDEIQAGFTANGHTTAWDQLTLDKGRSEDPPNLEPSITMYSDRYPASSTAICPKCDNFQLKIDYGTQAVGDELLKFAVFGAVFKERKQQ